MTPAVPAALPAVFPHTITVVQRDTVTLEELEDGWRCLEKILEGNR